MARTLEQIISELDNTYKPQINSLQERANLIPQQIQDEEAGLKAQQTQAFGDITNAARRRGLGFSGIPLGEQAQYTSTQFLPALARLRQSGKEQAMSLQDAINQIYERRDTLAQQLRQSEIEREFQAQQNELNRRAQAAAFASPTLGLSQIPAEQGQSILPKIQRTKEGGYNFFDAYGKPINAAEYVQLYQSAGGNLTYRQLLQQMANEGDANAKFALQHVGDDYRFGAAPDTQEARTALSLLGATGSFRPTSGYNITNTPIKRGNTVNTNISVPNYGWTRTK